VISIRGGLADVTAKCPVPTKVQALPEIALSRVRAANFAGRILSRTRNAPREQIVAGPPPGIARDLARLTDTEFIAQGLLQRDDLFLRHHGLGERIEIAAQAGPLEHRLGDRAPALFVQRLEDANDGIGADTAMIVCLTHEDILKRH